MLHVTRRGSATAGLASMERYLAPSGPLAGFERVAPLVENDRRKIELLHAMLSGLVHNEGNSWEQALGALGGFFEQIAANGTVAEPPNTASAAGSPVQWAMAAPPRAAEQFAGAHLRSAELLGRRTAEMHLALATDTGNPAFAEEPFSRHYQRSLYQNFRNQMARVYEFLEQRLDRWPRLWVEWMRGVYLRTYLVVAGRASFLPDRPEHTSTLLDAYLMEKAFYELQYELNNRPAWAHIPLGGIVRLLASQ